MKSSVSLGCPVVCSLLCDLVAFSSSRVMSSARSAATFVRLFLLPARVRLPPPRWKFNFLLLGRLVVGEQKTISPSDRPRRAAVASWRLLTWHSRAEKDGAPASATSRPPGAATKRPPPTMMMMII